MNTYLKNIYACFALALIQVPASAHHSFNAHYDGARSVTIEGTVTEFRLENPHSRFYVNVIDEVGEEVVWLVEMGSRNGMLRNGWTEDTIKPGDELRVTGAPGRKEANIMHQDGITTLDGAPVGPQR